MRTAVCIAGRAAGVPAGKTMNGLSLYSGIGGLDLAFNWAGGKILAFCEIEPFCQKVLHKHWPDVPIFGDVHGLTKEVMQNEGILQRVDIIYGGFPCQPFSVAGNQKGKNDTRYLWPEFARLVRELKPSWVLAENVPGILSIAADDICRDLECKGYEVGIWDFEAATVGAKHRRERIFFVAHARRTLRQGNTLSTNTDSERCQKQQQPFKTEPTQPITGHDSRREPKSRMGGMVNGLSAGLDENILNFWNTVPEPKEKTAIGIPNRVARLKALGNAVVPQQVYPLFKAIFLSRRFQH